MIFLDTHLLIWLYEAELELLSDKAKKLIENNSIIISPIVRLELEYLFEIKRLKVGSDKIITYLWKQIGLEISQDSYNIVIDRSLKEKWTRDPFDRIITAHARLNKAKLLTKDRKIHKHYDLAVW